MTFELRDAKRSDIDAITAIWRTGWTDGHLGHVERSLIEARTRGSFRCRTERRLTQTIVAATTQGAFLSAEIAGFVMVVDDEVEQIYVRTDHRGSGCANLLLHAAEIRIAEAGNPTAWLAVVAGNDRARSFYAKRGWSDSGPTTYMAAGKPGADDKIQVKARRYEKQLRLNEATTDPLVAGGGAVSPDNRTAELARGGLCVRRLRTQVASSPTLTVLVGGVR